MLVRFNVGTLKDVVDLDEIYLRNACKSPASNLTCLTLRSYHCRSNDQNFQNDPRMHYSKILKATALFDMVYEIKLNIEVGRLTYCIIYTLIARTSFIKQDCVRGGSTVMHAYLLLHIRASSREKNLILLYVNNKGTDQPAHLRSLFSSFLIHYLESMLGTYRGILQMYK